MRVDAAIRPVLESALTEIQLEHGGAPLAGWHIIGCQHVQGSLLQLVLGLIRLGVNPGAVELIAKDYSSHEQVVRELRTLGCTVHSEGAMDDPCRSYERQVDRIALRAIARAAGRLGRVLLIDEGGRLCRAAERLNLSKFAMVRAVEQTTRGIRLTAARRPSFPIVDVAGTPLKRNDESWLIARSMVGALEPWLTNPWKLADETTAAVVGYGAVGASLASLLSGQMRNLAIIEADSVRRTAAESNGHSHVWANLKEFASSNPGGAPTLLLSSTSRRGVSYQDLAHVAGDVILANCGSSDIEFPATDIRCAGEVWSGYLHEWCRGADCDTPWGHMYRCRERGRTIFLLNGGFPVNFAGQLDTVPLEDFLLTRTLMLVGCVQAVSTTLFCRGLQPLNVPKWLEKIFRGSKSLSG